MKKIFDFKSYINDFLNFALENSMVLEFEGKYSAHIIEYSQKLISRHNGYSIVHKLVSYEPNSRLSHLNSDVIPYLGNFFI